MCDTWPIPWNQIKSCRITIQEDIVIRTMYNIYITKPMDRFSSNGLTYPMNSHPTLGRNRTQPQPYNSAQNSNGPHHLTPYPRYRQTEAPEQVPLDWNIPFLPEISNSFPAASQPFVQDLNSALPPFSARVYPNGARASCGADTLCFNALTGGFPFASNHPLKVSWLFIQVDACLHFWCRR